MKPQQTVVVVKTSDGRTLELVYRGQVCVSVNLVQAAEQPEPHLQQEPSVQPDIARDVDRIDTPGGRRVPAEDKAVHSVNTPGGPQKATFVSESDCKPADNKRHAKPKDRVVKPAITPGVPQKPVSTKIHQRMTTGPERLTITSLGGDTTVELCVNARRDNRAIFGDFDDSQKSMFIPGLAHMAREAPAPQRTQSTKRLMRAIVAERQLKMADIMQARLSRLKLRQQLLLLLKPATGSMTNFPRRRADDWQALGAALTASLVDSQNSQPPEGDEHAR